MAPLNFKEWQDVLSQVDRNIYCDMGNTVSIVRAWRQRDGISKREVIGRLGTASVYVSNNLIIKAKIAHENGSKIFATRTSVAHNIRLGHSPWWTKSGEGRYGFATECGCVPNQFVPDYPTVTVTPFEDCCEPARVLHEERIQVLEARVNELQQAVTEGEAHAKVVGQELEATTGRLDEALDSNRAKDEIIVRLTRRLHGEDADEIVDDEANHNLGNHINNNDPDENMLNNQEHPGANDGVDNNANNQGHEEARVQPHSNSPVSLFGSPERGQPANSPASSVMAHPQQGVQARMNREGSLFGTPSGASLGASSREGSLIRAQPAAAPRNHGSRESSMFVEQDNVMVLPPARTPALSLAPAQHVIVIDDDDDVSDRGSNDLRGSASKRMNPSGYRAAGPYSYGAGSSASNGMDNASGQPRIQLPVLNTRGRPSNSSSWPVAIKAENDFD